MLRRLLIIGVALFAALVLIGLLLPSETVVEERVQIDAPPATVFTILNGYRQFNRWSPWADRDPQAEYRLSGPLTGVGARMDWRGDPDIVGSGSQTIVASEPWRRIEVTLDFGDDGQATSWFDLEPADGGTDVSWGFRSELGLNPVARYFGLLIGRWVGADYAQGLARLKSLAEGLADSDFSDAELELVDWQDTTIAWLPVETEADTAAVSQALGEAYFRLTRFLGERGLEAAGPPMARLRSSVGRARLDAAIPIAGRGDADGVPAADGVRLDRTPGGPALRVVHRGPYHAMDSAHAAAMAWLRASGLQRSGDPWEVYVSDPASTPEAELVSYLYYPIDAAR